ncbi:hypothetical protein PCASD_25813 [Puccinia coronata f. sp. avenae]|uniref:Uncharacterized protein n=1 Tax=Puccinia coronata f. sp. avenae TaxID=200324 RepID=A0A2N5TKT0_9BASI|nr:hypothetical protein PCASD_25813 [Puccinia coronata f. sp. avenae]
MVGLTHELRTDLGLKPEPEPVHLHRLGELARLQAAVGLVQPGQGGDDPGGEPSSDRSSLRTCSTPPPRASSLTTPSPPPSPPSGEPSPPPTTPPLLPPTPAFLNLGAIKVSLVHLKMDPFLPFTTPLSNSPLLTPSTSLSAKM